MAKWYFRSQFRQVPLRRRAEKRYPDFRHALGTQYVCDAVLESAKTKQWVDVKK